MPSALNSRNRYCPGDSGVLGPEAFDAVPFLDLLAGDYASPWGHREMAPV
jgi:hypothetical protein